jgi:hypothetical protein
MDIPVDVMQRIMVKHKAQQSMVDFVYLMNMHKSRMDGAHVSGFRLGSNLV